MGLRLPRVRWWACQDTQQAARSGKLAALLQASPPLTGRVVPSSTATAKQLEAVADFKMITETEATIRKAAGVGLGLATAFLYSTSGLACAFTGSEPL